MYWDLRQNPGLADIPASPHCTLFLSRRKFSWPILRARSAAHAVRSPLLVRRHVGPVHHAVWRSKSHLGLKELAQRPNMIDDCPESLPLGLVELSIVGKVRFAGAPQGRQGSLLSVSSFARPNLRSLVARCGEIGAPPQSYSSHVRPFLQALRCVDGPLPLFRPWRLRLLPSRPGLLAPEGRCQRPYRLHLPPTRPHPAHASAALVAAAPDSAEIAVPVDATPNVVATAIATVGPTAATATPAPAPATPAAVPILTTLASWISISRTV